MAECILIVDDERKIVQGLAAYFAQAGYETLAAYDGHAALALARAELPALIVLDWMLPGIDGVEVCRQLRRTSNVPIIMLTARVGEGDTLLGLEAGADDYVAKPFSPREVVARARAVLRRTRGDGAAPDVLRAGSFELDAQRHTLRVAGQLVELTPTEFTLLSALMRHSGLPLSRAQLADALAEGFDSYERTIDAHIKNLRRKVEPNPAEPRHVVTVFGVGYKFEA